MFVTTGRTGSAGPGRERRARGTWTPSGLGGNRRDHRVRKPARTNPILLAAQVTAGEFVMTGSRGICVRGYRASLSSACFTGPRVPYQTRNVRARYGSRPHRGEVIDRHRSSGIVFMLDRTQFLVESKSLSGNGLKTNSGERNGMNEPNASTTDANGLASGHGDLRWGIRLVENRLASGLFVPDGAMNVALGN